MATRHQTLLLKAGKALRARRAKPPSKSEETRSAKLRARAARARAARKLELAAKVDREPDPELIDDPRDDIGPLR